MLAAPLLALLCAPPGADEIPALIRDLGAPTYARREKSVATLRAKGKSALPALAEAINSKDVEVRERASALIAQIRRDDLIGPTLLALDFRDRPLPEVVRDLARRSGFAISLHAAPGPSRNITLVADAPVPFWEALERLEEVAAVRESREPLASADPNASALDLHPTSIVGPHPPAWIDGKFRVRQVSSANVPHNLPRFGGLGRRQAAIDPGAPSSVIFLEVAVEPQATILQTGPVEFAEVIGTKGEPIRAFDVGFDDERQFDILAARGELGPAIRGFGAASDRVTAVIRLAATGDRRPALIKGKIPLIISKPTDPPTVIDLANARGKAIEIDGAVLRVADFSIHQPSQTAELTLSLKPNQGAGEGANPNPRTRDPWPDLKAADDDGNPLVSTSFPPRQPPQGGEIMRTWNIRIGGNGKPPTKLLVRNIEIATAAVAFEFRDVQLTGD